MLTYYWFSSEIDRKWWGSIYSGTYSSSKNLHWRFKEQDFSNLLWKSNFVWFWLCHRRRQWRPTPVLLPGKSHGWRSLVGCNPWGRKESDTTERLHFHFSLFMHWRRNGNPLQCSCLENPRDGGAWWAAVYGVVQSQTRLKRLSSSSSRLCHESAL